MFASPLDPPRTADSEWTTNAPRMPEIWKGQSFLDLVRSLALYISETIDVPQTFEELRTGQGAPLLVPLSNYLTTCHHPNIVAALLVLKWHYSKSDPDDRGINATRASVCEIVAWRFLSHLPEREVLDYLLYELVEPEPPEAAQQPAPERASGNNEDFDREEGHEWAAASPATPHRAHFSGTATPESLVGYEEDDPTKPFIGFTSLEIAVVAEAKRFLGQRKVQKIVNAIWCGDIIFWESLNVQAMRKAQKYIKWKTDPYSRLRVPLYMKVFEILFTASFLLIYYAVLFERNEERITVTESLLFIWVAAFTYDEIGEIQDTASLIYTRDFWNYWDVGVVVVGIAYMITRVIGLAQGRKDIVDTAFDILSLEALFLVPRLFSLLSLNTYFGTLIPCLKDMTKSFVKFLVIVVVLYVGFLTTFTMLGRAYFTVRQIAWILLNVLFGAASIGLGVSGDISQELGPPLMIVFVCMTNILLLSSLISLLSSSLTRVMAHAREEYFFQYSVFVLDTSASKRLTYFFPPLNLLPLVLLRPLRLVLSGPTVRSARISLLKATHGPFVAAIWAYESLRARWRRADDGNWYKRPTSALGDQQPHPRSLSHSHSLRRPQLLGRSAAASRAGQRPTLTALTNKSEISLVRPGVRADTFEEIEELKGAVSRLTGLVGELSDKLERIKQPGHD